MSDMSETEDVNLIVENGTCVTGANSYISLTDADTYMKNAGHSTWSALDENTRKSCLINGTLYIDHIYSKYGWYGVRKYPKQELCFPRVEIVDSDGVDLDGQIPEVLKKAVCEAAFIATTVSLFSTKDANGAVKRVKIDVIEKEFFENSTNTNTVDYISPYEILDALLAGLYRTKRASNVHRVIWYDLAGGSIGGR